MSAAPSALGLRVKTAMETQGLTVTGLARAAGLPHHAPLSKLLGGARQDLDLDTLRKLTSPLGLTLAQLVGDDAAPAPVEAPATGQAMLALRQINRSGLNPRKHFDQEALEELAASIQAQGLLQNLVVRRAAGDHPEMPPALRKYELVAGERRLRALQILESRGQWDATAQTIPVRVIEGDDAQHLALALLENLQRQDVNAMEEAEAFSQLQALEPERWTTTAIAAAIGCTPRHIQQRLALVSRLAEPAQDALRTGQISATQARVLMLAPPDKQASTLKTIGRFRTTDELKNHLTGGLVPVSRAHFDLDAYDGEIMEMEGGARYFADTGHFLAAQNAAALATVERLRGEWAWAELSPNPVPPWDRAYERARVQDPAIAGALVWLDWQNTVVVETGFVRVNADKRAAEQQAAEAARAAEEAELDEFGHAVHRLLRRADGLAEKLLVIEGLSPRSFSGADVGYRRGVPARHIEEGGAFHWLPANGVRICEVGGWVMLADAPARGAAWRAVNTLAPDALAQALRVIVAARLEISFGPNALLGSIARAAGIAIPSSWQEGQGDLEDAIAGSPDAGGDDGDD